MRKKESVSFVPFRAQHVIPCKIVPTTFYTLRLFFIREKRCTLYYGATFQPYFFTIFPSYSVNSDPLLACVLRRWCTIQQCDTLERRKREERNPMGTVYPLRPVISHFDLSFHHFSRYLNPGARIVTMSYNSLSKN